MTPCDTGNCVETTITPSTIKLRDTKLGPNSPTITLTTPEWWTYIAAVKTHQLDRYPGPLQLQRHTDGWHMTHTHQPALLRFNDAEIVTFHTAIHAGHLDPKPAPAGAAA